MDGRFERGWGTDGTRIWVNIRACEHTFRSLKAVREAKGNREQNRFSNAISEVIVEDMKRTGGYYHCS